MVQDIKLDQVSIWEVIEPTKIMIKQQNEIKKIKFSWYRGGFFEIDSISCNMITIEIENNIRKITYVVDRHGNMDQITCENEILKPHLFWKNINKIIFSNIEINIPRDAFIEDRFCIRVNDEKILAGPFINKKRDKDLVKFFKYIDLETALKNIDEIIKKY